MLSTLKIPFEDIFGSKLRSFYDLRGTRLIILGPRRQSQRVITAADCARCHSVEVPYTPNLGASTIRLTTCAEAWGWRGYCKSPKLRRRRAVRHHRRENDSIIDYGLVGTASHHAARSAVRGSVLNSVARTRKSPSVYAYGDNWRSISTRLRVLQVSATGGPGFGGEAAGNSRLLPLEATGRGTLSDPKFHRAANRCAPERRK